MVLKSLKDKKIANKAYSLYEVDENDSIHTTGVDVDDAIYDNGTFLDRDYDLRAKKNISINIENIGANAIKYKILSTNKHFDDLDAEITDDDFDKEEKAETSLNPRSKATGSVELTGGPAVAADGTVTLASALAIAAATGTVTCASVLAGDTVTINGLVYTAVAGAKANNTEFSIDTGDNECAADLADSITNDARAGTLNDVTATSSTNVVTCTQTVAGAGGNATTLVSSNGTRLAVSGAGTFSNGVNADTVTVNGLVYTAVAGAKANNTQFSIDTSNDAAATDLAASIENDTRPGIDEPGINLSASSVGAVVTIIADTLGTDGNNITLLSSHGTRLALSAAALDGGVDSSMNGITVGGVQIMSGAVSYVTSLAATATAIAANINAFTSNPKYTAVAVGTLITISATVNEPSTAAVASSTTTLTKTDVNMSGGGGGKADTFELVKTTPSITAIRLRAKESSGGSPGKIRADIKAN